MTLLISRERRRAEQAARADRSRLLEAKEQAEKDSDFAAAACADIFATTDGLMFVSDWNAGLNVLQYQG